VLQKVHYSPLVRHAGRDGTFKILHKTFYVELVERAAADPLPSQITTDTRLGPILIPAAEDEGDQEEYAVEEILAAKNARGRGGGRQVLVKWVGYNTPDWQPLSLFTDTEALDRFEARWGDVRTNNGPASHRKQGQKVRGGNSLVIIGDAQKAPSHDYLESTPTQPPPTCHIKAADGHRHTDLGKLTCKGTPARNRYAKTPQEHNPKGEEGEHRAH